MIRQNFYKGSTGVILMYDITKIQTFTNLFLWIIECWSSIGHPVPLIILGNKQDLEAERQVTEEAVRSIVTKLSQLFMTCNGFRISYLPTSAVTSLNVKEAFSRLAYSVIEWRQRLKDQCDD